MTKIYGSDSSNASSAIFLLDVCGDKYFFSGDASAPHNIEGDNVEDKFEETDFVNSLTQKEIDELLSIDVYLVAHHGSKYSSSEKFLNLIMPKFAVVSVGKNNYGHPSNEVVSRLKNLISMKDDGVLSTAQCGNITFSSINDETVFVLEKTTKYYKLLIPYEILMIILYVLIECFVINIRPYRKKTIDT